MEEPPLDVGVLGPISRELAQQVQGWCKDEDAAGIKPICGVHADQALASAASHDHLPPRGIGLRPLVDRGKGVRLMFARLKPRRAGRGELGDAFWPDDWGCL